MAFKKGEPNPDRFKSEKPQSPDAQKVVDQFYERNRDRMDPSNPNLPENYHRDYGAEKKSEKKSEGK